MMVAQRAQHIDEQVGKWSGRIGLFIAGWLAASAYYGTLHLNHVEKVDLPKAQALAGCEHWRAKKAETVAKKAITGALVDTAPIPSPTDIPKDNCPVAAK